MTLIAERNFLAAATTGTDGEPIKIFAPQRIHFNLYRRQKYVQDISVIISTEQQVSVLATSLLFVSVAAPPAITASIKTLFQAYDANRDGDPVLYASSNLPPGATANMFAIVPSYKLTKVGSPVVNNRNLIELLAFYDGSLGGTMVDATGQELNAYIRDEDLKLVPTYTEDLPAFPTAFADTHVVQVKDPTAPDASIFSNLVTGDSKGLDCVTTSVDHVRIMTLLSWPEFEVVPHGITIDLGCGVHIIITVPQLLTRSTSLVLWAYIGHAPNLMGLLLNQVLDCLVKAAVSGVVTGLVTLNYYAAAAAFEGEFEQDLLVYAGKDLTCLVPGIAVLTDSSPWQPH